MINVIGFVLLFISASSFLSSLCIYAEKHFYNSDEQKNAPNPNRRLNPIERTHYKVPWQLFSGLLQAMTSFIVASHIHAHRVITCFHYIMNLEFYKHRHYIFSGGRANIRKLT